MCNRDYRRFNPHCAEAIDDLLVCSIIRYHFIKH